MSEFEPTRSEQRPMDQRRLDVASRRWASRITEGIEEAAAEAREIDHETARMIAHALGRAFGRESALADFGRTGEGSYERLRDEYLSLYQGEAATPQRREWIDWLGTYLVQRENAGSGRRFMNEHLPPKLEQLLVPTMVPVNETAVTMHVPASFDAARIAEVAREIAQLSADQDEALQAFLSLPDVNAGADNLMETFHETYSGVYSDIEDVLRALTPLEDWESELADWAIDHAIEPEALQFNFTPLVARLAEIYDVVERGGRLYAFVK